ncbi:MAG: hypothetical protein JWQ27_2089 [Ferruginibacter sp.]|nr:hypothetical protein [Ferruginibacter sp.]
MFFYQQRQAWKRFYFYHFLSISINFYQEIGKPENKSLLCFLIIARGQQEYRNGCFISINLDQFRSISIRKLENCKINRCFVFDLIFLVNDQAINHINFYATIVSQGNLNGSFSRNDIAGVPQAAAVNKGTGDFNRTIFSTALYHNGGGYMCVVFSYSLAASICDDVYPVHAVNGILQAGPATGGRCAGREKESFKPAELWQRYQSCHGAVANKNNKFKLPQCCGKKMPANNFATAHHF